MSRYRNVNTGAELSESEYRDLLSREYEEISSTWYEDGFSSMEECINWIKENDIDTDFVEIEEDTI